MLWLIWHRVPSDIYIYYIDLNDSILLINNDKIKTYSHTKDNIEQNRGGAANKNGEKKNSRNDSNKMEKKQLCKKWMNKSKWNWR